jgi:hypothetical protein
MKSARARLRIKILTAMLTQALTNQVLEQAQYTNIFFTSEEILRKIFTFLRNVRSRYLPVRLPVFPVGQQAAQYVHASITPCCTSENTA